MITAKINCYGKEIIVTPSLNLYTEVYDYNDEQKLGLAICLNVVKNDVITEPFATLTVNLGEFISVPNAVYVDTNNCPFAKDLIINNNWGMETNYTKHSGFCEYPLFVLERCFLKSLNPDLYQKYISQLEYKTFEKGNIGECDEER